MARLTKVDGERGLYKDPSSGTYFVRVYHNGTDTFRSLETARIKEAIERLDARRAAKAAARFVFSMPTTRPNTFTLRSSTRGAKN